MTPDSARDDEGVRHDTAHLLIDIVNPFDVRG